MLQGPQTISEAELVRAALVRPAAFGAIVERFEPVLLRYVRRLLGQHKGACFDVLQETFIKAYVNLNDYDTTRPLSPWMYRIAHNETYNHLRKKSAEPFHIGGDDAQAILDGMMQDQTISDQLVSDERDAHLRTTIAAMDIKYRDIIVLRYLEDKSYTEIADILHLPAGTVAIRLKRGLEKLRAAMADHGGRS